jgi:hypothetical protein
VIENNPSIAAVLPGISKENCQIRFLNDTHSLHTNWNISDYLLKVVDYYVFHLLIKVK